MSSKRRWRRSSFSYLPSETGTRSIGRPIACRDSKAGTCGSSLSGAGGCPSKRLPNKLLSILRIWRASFTLASLYMECGCWISNAPFFTPTSSQRPYLDCKRFLTRFSGRMLNACNRGANRPFSFPPHCLHPRFPTRAHGASVAGPLFHIVIRDASRRASSHALRCMCFINLRFAQASIVADAKQAPVRPASRRWPRRRGPRAGPRGGRDR